MTYQIIKIDIEKHKDLFEHICRYLWKEWKPHYLNLHGFDKIEELFSMYKNIPTLELFAGINDNGHFTGCYSIRNIDDIYWLTDVFVNPEYRRKGIGTSLIRHAIEGKNKVLIHVEPHLVKFYSKFGFEKEHNGYMKGRDGRSFEYFRMKYMLNDEMKFITYIIIAIATIGCIAILCVLLKY